mgnify:CR=1 FL=1
MSYASPTGTGKSIVELEVQQRVDEVMGPGTWIVTPREEIVVGMLDKLEFSGDPMEKRICTPIRLRNAVMRGDVPPPLRFIFDEGHHHNAETWQQLNLLSGLAPALARDCEQAVREGRMQVGEIQALKRFYESELDGYAYLEP